MEGDLKHQEAGNQEYRRVTAYKLDCLREETFKLSQREERGVITVVVTEGIYSVCG